MIKILNRNFKSIKKAMELSQTTEYNWFDYAKNISNGLSNNQLIKPGCGDIIFFVERMNQYAKLSNEYLQYAVKLKPELIEFINIHRQFLITIN